MAAPLAKQESVAGRTPVKPMRESEVDRLPRAAHRGWLGAFLAGAGAVLGWKLGALALLLGGRESGSELPALPLLLSLAGLVFVLCGLLVLWRRPWRAAVLFAGYALCAGLHWGGPLELGEGSLRTALILVYLLISGVLAACLLLHFALVFPRRLLGGRQQIVVRSVYAAFALAAVLALVAIVLPAPEVRRAALGGFLLSHTLISNLFSAGALAIFVVHLVRPGVDRRQKRWLALLVGGMLVAWLPNLVASALGAEADAWNLTVVALPVAATLALFGSPEPRRNEV